MEIASGPRKRHEDAVRLADKAGTRRGLAVGVSLPCTHQRRRRFSGQVLVLEAVRGRPGTSEGSPNRHTGTDGAEGTESVPLPWPGSARCK